MAPVVPVPFALSLHTTAPAIGGHDGDVPALRQVSVSPMYGKIEVRVSYRTCKVHNTMRGKFTYRPLFPPSLPLAVLAYRVCPVPLALGWHPLPFVGPICPLRPSFVLTFFGLLRCPGPICLSAHNAYQSTGHTSVVPWVALAPALCSGLVLPPALSVCARTVSSKLRGIPVPTPLSLLLGPLCRSSPLLPLRLSYPRPLCVFSRMALCTTVCRAPCTTRTFPTFRLCHLSAASRSAQVVASHDVPPATTTTSARALAAGGHS